MSTVLSVENLRVSVIEKNRVIVNDVSFDVCEGEIVVLSGANGCGKSTIIKSILREDESGKKYSGSISFGGLPNILRCTESEIQQLRKKIGYVPQRDDYDSKGKVIRVSTCLNDSAVNFINSRKLSKEEMQQILERFAPEKEKHTQFDIDDRPARLSGGQQRLLSVISAVAIRKSAKLFVIDEPLNNLDYDNMRNISNLINSIHIENPKAAFLIVTHCRIFPFVTKRIEMSDGCITSVNTQSHCFNCVGTPNGQGYYK